MVTLYNKSENSWFFLLKKWELLWQLNLNITCQHFVPLQNFIYQAPVVQTSDSAIHRINLYPADSVIDFRNTYPLDSDLASG